MTVRLTSGGDALAGYRPGIYAHLCILFVSQVVVGVVYNPFTSELYQAVKGGGAFLNGRGLEVSCTTAMKEAMVVSGDR